MKDKIINKAEELFLSLGFKSVTMDDIATALGVSKKTLYKYFDNKSDLVETCACTMHESFINIIEGITDQKYNAIRENFEVKKIFREIFKNAAASPVYQLKKYYPEIHEKVMKEEVVVFSECIKSNIERGIKEGYYRVDIDIDLYIQFYFSLVFGIHEKVNDYQKLIAMEHAALEYHTRAIATEKGIKELEQQLQINPI